ANSKISCRVLLTVESVVGDLEEMPPSSLSSRSPFFILFELNEIGVYVIARVKAARRKN
ncbi:hypothetical protein PC129_g25520, partial [Phytophthora cactorum]